MNVRRRPTLRTQSRFGPSAARSCSIRHAYEERVRLWHIMNGGAKYPCRTRAYERCHPRPIPLAQRRCPGPHYFLQNNPVHLVGPPGCLLHHGRPSQVWTLAGTCTLDKFCQGGNNMEGRGQQLTGQASPGAADTLNDKPIK